MTSREKFEAWAKKEKLGIAYGDCGYVFSSTEMAWRAWQYQDADMAVQLANAESKSRELAARTVKLPDINEFLAEVHDKTLNLAFRRLAEGVREADIYAIRAAGISVKGE